MRRPVRLLAALVAAAIMAFPPAASAFSPDARCEGMMVSQWTVEVDPGAFANGEYTAWWKFTGPATGGEPVTYLGPWTFAVSDAEPLVRGNALLYDGVTFNPGQDAYFWAGFVFDMTGKYFGPYTMSQARADLAASAIFLGVTPGGSDALPTEWVAARGGPLASSCAGLFGAAWMHRTYPSK